MLGPVVVYLTTLLAFCVAEPHFLLYAPTVVDSSYASAISSLGKTWGSVNAAQFNSMSVDAFQKYRAIVFADPRCVSGGPSNLPTTNLNNLFLAANGNAVIIGTDELFHWGQGGRQMATSVLDYVSADATKTGLYISFSCYYHGASPQIVPFLIPIKKDKAFETQGAPGCFNNAHIVAVSPALKGLTDSQVSGWSCSVHEVFQSFPSDWLPLAIARGVTGPGALTFSDGSSGIPYILARGATLSPLLCGDKTIQGTEQCDGGEGCGVDCKCKVGFTPFSPPRSGCQNLDWCGQYGYSGKPAFTLSCTNGANSRTITCQAGYFVTGSGMDVSSITITPGSGVFSGCSEANFCTLYGYSGKPANAISCVPDVAKRTITCATGYHAVGSSPSTSAVVTLTGAAAFGGCALIDNCVEYGYSGKPAGVSSCSNGVNERTISCLIGYYAIAPSGGTITLKGSAPFAGCTLIDMCASYGYSGHPEFTTSCTNAVNKRTITCNPGYYAMAGNPPGPSVNNTQWEGGLRSITIEGALAFAGCAEMDHCRIFGCKDGVSSTTTKCTPKWGDNARVCICPTGYTAVGKVSPEATSLLSAGAPFAGCTAIKGCALYGTPDHAKCEDTGPDTRTITCAPGYYAIAPDNPKIVLVGKASFEGCKVIDMCAVYGAKPKPDNVKSCTNSAVNERTILCNPGYAASAPVTPSIKLTGPVDFAGCTLIDNCAVYGYSGRSKDAKSCENGVDSRTITCNLGFFALAGPPPVEKVTLIGSAPFAGCTVTDYCTVTGDSKAPFVKSCTNTEPFIREVVCKAGYYAVAPATDKITLKGSETFPGCKVIDMCAVYGFSGKTTYSDKCVNSAVNERTITCLPGYFPTGTSDNTKSITLVGSAPFIGCTEQNECTLHGFSGKPEFTKDCVDAGLGKRTITCLPGYWVKGTKDTSITLIDDALFEGCVLVDNCVEYGFSGKPDFTDKCTNGVNKRTITCKSGYKAVDPDVISITLTGSDAFKGCVLIDTCLVYGYSGKTDFTESCKSGIDTRTVTCRPGYAAIAPDVRSITLPGRSTFVGCTLIDTCGLYSYSGKGDNAVSCVSGINIRTITCAKHYYATAPTNPNVTLTGNATFAGCKPVDMCATNENGKNVAKCVTGIGERTITCEAGYYAVAPATPTTVVKGAVAFTPGCTRIDDCKVYACEDPIGKQNTTCDNSAVDKRTCTCPKGWAVIPGKTGSVVLSSGAKFTGCAPICGDSLKVGPETCDDGNTNSSDGCSSTCQIEIGWVCPTVGKPCMTVCGDGYKRGKEACDDNNTESGDGCDSSCLVEPGWSCETEAKPCILLRLCDLYGYDGNGDHAKSCTNGINTRTILCEDGYFAIAPYFPSIVVVGNNTFKGCFLIDNCAVYGTSGRPEHVTQCVNGVNQRTISCDAGFYAVYPTDPDVTLIGNEEFFGCVELGFVCSKPDEECCREIAPITSTPLYCLNGWWTSKDDPGGPIVLSNTSGHSMPEGVKMCGTVVIDNTFSEINIENNLTLNGTEWAISGGLVVYGSTIYFINGGNVSLNDADGKCGGIILKRQDDRVVVNTTHPLWLSANSTLAYRDVHWTAEEGMPLPMIVSTSKKCVHQDGVFSFWADNIPNGSNKFQAITTQCIEGPTMAVNHDIPGTCSDVEIWTDNEGMVTVNRKHLCTASIVAMSVVVPAGLAALGAGAYMYAGYNPVTVTDYYTL